MLACNISYNLPMKDVSGFLKNFTRNLRQNFQAMSSTPETGRSQTNSFPVGTAPDLRDEGLKHASQIANLAKEANKQLCIVRALEISVSSSDSIKAVSGFLHIPQKYEDRQSENRMETGAILLSGAGGGVVGPSSVYLSIADKLASLDRGIPVLRLDYRYPARNKYCVSDVLAAMDYLKRDYAVGRIVLVGWSYGGAPVFTVGGDDDRVVGCATVASQTAETNGIVQVAHKAIPVLLMHGTGDQRLGASCSESLRDRYLKYGSRLDVQLKLFDGDDHSLSHNSLKVEELLCDFIMKQAGEKVQSSERADILQKPVLGEQEKIEKMEAGGDLRGESFK